MSAVANVRTRESRAADVRAYVCVRIVHAHSRTSRTQTGDFGRQPSTVPTDAREIRRADEVLFGSGSLTVLKWQVGRSERGV